MMKRLFFSFLLPSLLGLLLTACAAPSPTPPASTPTRGLTLTPYRPALQPSPTLPVLTATPVFVPSPTATPRTHTVQRGEDMFGIALRYGVSLDALKAANPEVNPNFLSVGAVLVIPPGGFPEPTPSNPTPTPSPLRLHQPDCWPGADGGVTCFILAENPSEQTLENPAARVRLALEDGETVENEAYALLNLLPAGARLPLLVFFPGPLPSLPAPTGVRAAADPLVAFPLQEGETRYVDVALREVETSLQGRAALLRGRILPAADCGTAWVAGWGLDSEGRVVAARRWEASGLPAGEPQPFEIMLNSLSGEIVQVELLAEGRP